jgi:hypothetical protein
MPKQQGDQARRIGVVMNPAADDPESSTRLMAFVQKLQKSGIGQWTVSQAMAPSIGVAAKRACGWTAGKLPCIVEPKTWSRRKRNQGSNLKLIGRRS